MATKQVRPYHPFRSEQARERYLADYDSRAARWPLQSESSLIRTAHGDTYVRVLGPAGGPPLVMLTGVWIHSQQWPVPLIEALSREFRTYLPDNIYDFGRSVSARPGGTAADHNAWLDGLFDALGVSGNVNLFGISRGAWITAEYVLHAPERLVKAVWMSPALVVCRPSWRNAANGPRSLAAMAKPSKRTLSAMLRWLMPELAARDSDCFEDEVEAMLLGLQCYAHPTNVTGPRVFSPAEFGRIKLPVLYLAGEDEKMCSPKTAVRRLTRVAPRTETAVLPGGGHDLIDLEPQAVAERVLAFLRR